MRTLSQIRAAQNDAATTETKPQTTQPASNSPEPKADKKPKTAKKPTENSQKMQEQYEGLAKFLREYFEQEAKTDKAFAAKYADGKGKKTALDAAKYLFELHRPANRGPVAATSNADDNAIAKEFIMNDAMTIASVTKKDNTPLNKTQTPPPPPQDDADLDLDDLDEQPKPTTVPEGSPSGNRKPAKPSKPKATKPEPQPQPVDDLDDFDF